MVRRAATPASGSTEPPPKKARSTKTGSKPEPDDLVLADLLGPKVARNEGSSRTAGRRAVPEAPRPAVRGPVLPAVAGDGEARRRQAKPSPLEEVVIGWYVGSADPTPIRLVRKGKDLVQGEVFETQSDEIRKEHPDAPIAKAHRAKYNWVAETSGGRFTRDPNKMIPVVRTAGMIGKFTCDVCGKGSCGSLYVFRAFLRKEHLRGSSARHLDPFVAYISFRCGRGLLGQLTEYTRFKEEVYSLTTSKDSIEDARLQLEESLRRCNREDRQFLIDELERLAGVGVTGGTKTVEMESVERMIPGQAAVLLRSAEDVFRAMARTLAPRVNARLLAAAAVAVCDANLEGYLQGAAASLRAGGPLPQAPARWPFREVVGCIEAALRACNGEQAALLRVELACSWDSTIKAFGPSKAAVTIRLGYLQARQALHAFAPSSRPSKEEASAMQQRLEQAAGSMAVPQAPGEDRRLTGVPAPLPASVRPRHIGRAESLGYGWHAADWAQRLKDLLAADFDFSQRPLRLVTGCSGAEAPHFALRQLVGHQGFQQLFGSEINENPRRFILRNCNAQHLFEDVMYVMEGSGPCARHGGRCPVPRGEVDIFVGGFPCTPYSFCNPKRFKRNCFTEPAAAPFFEMRKFIAERRPRLVILENVRGLLAPNPETEHPPIDFILRGRNPENPEDCYQGTAPNADWGLSLIEGYGLRWDILYSYDWGLPQSRPRVYIVMVREDAGGQKAAEHIFEVLSACAGRLPRGSCNDFLYPDDHPKLELANQRSLKGGVGQRRPCTKFTEALFRTKRQELGLSASDRPYSKARPDGWFPQATEKMVQQLDIIYAIAEKQGLDFNFLLADLSQQVSRGAWRDDGNIPTLTTACSLYSFSRHRPFLGEECLRLNGFPLEELNLDNHTENELVFLAGNAMSVPVVGAVLFAGLVSLDWGENRRSTASSALPSPVEQRPDIRKVVDNAVVLAKATPSLVDDDCQETADIQDPEASIAETEETALARRAAVLLAMAKELSQEPAKRDKGPSETKLKTGLVAAIQAVAQPTESAANQEEVLEGDGTGWAVRYTQLESKKAPDIQLCRWLQEAVHLLASMDREEMLESAGDLGQFVVKSLKVFREAKDSDLACLADQGLAETMKKLLQLRFSEAKPVWGRLLTEELLSALPDSPKGSEVESWLNKAALLEGIELSPQRARLLEELSRSRRRLARLLAALLRKWSPESKGDQELLWSQKTIEALLKAWTTGDPPDAWLNLAAVCKVSKSCMEIAQSCERQNRPKSSQSFRESAQKLQSEVFACRLARVLTVATDNPGVFNGLRDEFEQMSSEDQELVVCPQTAVWKLWRHLKRLQPKTTHVEFNIGSQAELDEMAKTIAALRSSRDSEDLALQVDSFLRRFFPSAAAILHAIEHLEAQALPPQELNQRLHRLIHSEQNLHDLLKTRLSPLFEIKLSKWAPSSRGDWEEELGSKISEWSNQLNMFMKGVHHLISANGNWAQQAHQWAQQAIQMQSVLQEQCARLLLFERLASINDCDQVLGCDQVVTAVVTLLESTVNPPSMPKAMRNLEISCEKAGILEPARTDVQKAAVSAVENHLPLLPNWVVAHSRAGLRFFQYGEGRSSQTSWSWPLSLPSLAQPQAPPEDKGLMTPPHSEPDAPSSTEKKRRSPRSPLSRSPLSPAAPQPRTEASAPPPKQPSQPIMVVPETPRPEECSPPKKIPAKQNPLPEGQRPKAPALLQRPAEPMKPPKHKVPEPQTRAAAATAAGHAGNAWAAERMATMQNQVAQVIPSPPKRSRQSLGVAESGHQTPYPPPPPPAVVPDHRQSLWLPLPQQSLQSKHSAPQHVPQTPLPPPAPNLALNLAPELSPQARLVPPQEVYMQEERRHYAPSPEYDGGMEDQNGEVRGVPRGVLQKYAWGENGPPVRKEPPGPPPAHLLRGRHQQPAEHSEPSQPSHWRHYQNYHEQQQRQQHHTDHDQQQQQWKQDHRKWDSGSGWSSSSWH